MVTLPLLLGACAALYASVGFGGGSAYLAILTVFGFVHAEVVPLTLALNVIVVSGGTWHFVRAGHFRPRLLLPFLCASIPAAYVGARIDVPTDVWRYTAAGVLLLSALFLGVRMSRAEGTDAALLERARLWRVGPLLGGVLGFMSGVVGLGGGVFLAPALHVLRWGRTKQIAAAASVFILLNSLAGLAGHSTRIPPGHDAAYWALLGAAVLAGGQLGSRLGAYLVPAAAVRAATAAILVFAGSRLLLTTPLGARTGMTTLHLLLILCALAAAVAVIAARAALPRRSAMGPHPTRS